jgi:hypothetical protein
VEIEHLVETGGNLMTKIIDDKEKIISFPFGYVMNYDEIMNYAIRITPFV